MDWILLVALVIKDRKTEIKLRVIDVFFNPVTGCDIEEGYKKYFLFFLKKDVQKDCIII